MGIDTAFRVMGILPVRTPTRLVSEHVECKHLQRLVLQIQVLIQSTSLKEGCNYQVILDILNLQRFVGRLDETILLHIKVS